MGTIFVGACLVVLVAVIIRSMYHAKRCGKSPSCGGNCSKCGGQCH